MKRKKPRKWNEQSTIRGALRQVFSRSPVIREVLQRARREVPRTLKDGSMAKRPAVQYLCASCMSWTPSKDVQVDHVSPVISTEDGFQGWNTFVARLFCSADNLQVLCSVCHQAKTNRERAERISRRRNDLP